MDTTFMARFLPMYVRAALLTLRLGATGILLSLAVGALCCLARYFRVPVLRRIAAVYIELARNTPLLVQLFFLYFGLPKIGVKLSAETCAIVGLTFLGGAYMAESLRSGLEAVDRVQQESGMCLGLTPMQNMRFVILPQALATAIPSIGANAVFLVKETSVFSAVSDVTPRMDEISPRVMGCPYATIASTSRAAWDMRRVSHDKTYFSIRSWKTGWV